MTRTLKPFALLPIIAGVAALLGACGAEFVKPATSEEIQSYPNVIAYAKARYTGLRVSAGLSQWWQGADGNLEVASFRIVTNRTGWIDDAAAFDADMKSFCETRGGRYTTLFDRQTAKIEEALNNQFSDAASQFMRQRGGNVATFNCSTAPGQYLFYGEAIFRPESGEAVAVRTRLNQGAAGALLSGPERPSVR